MNSQETPLPPNHQHIVNRFVAACQADTRVVAALLVGSYAKGTADTHSDLDLYLITTDEAYDDFCAELKAFIPRLGEPLFQEDFGSPSSALFILSDGTEGELIVGSEGRLPDLFSGPYQVLLDKKHILAGVEIPWHEATPSQADQIKTLRRQIEWFWHDLSHFITAMERGELWWGYGQLETLRRYAVNLARLRHNFSDVEVGEEAYFKVDRALPTEQLAPLQTTFCPREPSAMLQAALVIVRFYQELAPGLAQTHGVMYPADLDRVLSDRLQRLSQAHLG
jgi:hypothetical protein